MITMQFYRLKCKQCNSKFTVTTNLSCSKCKFLGVLCQHRTLCFKCYKQALRDGVFFAYLATIATVTLYGLGGSLI